MTRVQAIGVMLIALGLAYAVLYAAWLRRQRRHRSAAAAVVTDGSGVPLGAEVVSAMGAYEGTEDERTGEKVTTAGLRTHGPGSLLVRRGDRDHLVTLERSGQDDLRITAGQLVSARREQGRSGRPGRRGVAPLALVWRGEDGTTFLTRFRPRFEEDLDKVESALWWHATRDETPQHPGDGATETTKTTTRTTAEEETAS